MGSHCSFLGRGHYTTLAHVGFTKGSRGVTILIKKSPPFCVTQQWVDPGETYVAIQGIWNRKKLLLISAYAPP